MEPIFMELTDRTDLLAIWKHGQNNNDNNNNKKVHCCNCMNIVEH